MELEKDILKSLFWKFILYIHEHFIETLTNVDFTLNRHFSAKYIEIYYHFQLWESIFVLIYFLLMLELSCWFQTCYDDSKYTYVQFKSNASL